MTGSGEPSGDHPGTRDLVLLTLNLWGGNGPAEGRLAALTGYLERHRADVLTLQEVDGSGGETQAHQLARRLGYAHLTHTWTGRTRLRGEGLAIVSDVDLEPVETARLPSSATDHPRAAQIADLRWPLQTRGRGASGRSGPAATVRLVNTHLAWRLDATQLRTRQVRAIRDALEVRDGPAVVAGDLNDVAGSEALRVLTGPSADAGGFLDPCATPDDGTGPPRPTFDDTNPYLWQPELAGRRVDHVLVRGLAVRDVAVVLDGESGPVVSDHFGVRVRLAPP